LEVDILIGKRVFAFVAVYMPHAGYHIDILNSTYDLLMHTSTAATRRGNALIVGGDFNAQLGTGSRGAQLENFAGAFGLSIANGYGRAEEEDMWTFRGTLGALRRIDYILVPDYLQVGSAQACNDIDLGSDHRTVLACLKICSHRPKRRSRNINCRNWKPRGDVKDFHHALDSRIRLTSPKIVLQLEHILFGTAVEHMTPTGPNEEQGDEFESLRFQNLLATRRDCRDRDERGRLTKELRKLVRQILRKKKSRRMQEVLQEFEDLQRIDLARQAPVRQKQGLSQDDASAGELSEFLSEIFRSETAGAAAFLDGLAARKYSEIVPFTMPELRRAVSKMKNRKCADEGGLVADMFKHASGEFLRCLLQAFNQMLVKGELDSSWHRTLFTMIPKSGSRKDPANWRPIAVLRVSYKIFSRLIHQRLRPILEEQQSHDQRGFRPNCSVEDAFLVFEGVTEKCIEWNIPLWMASLDLRKAFDRVEYPALFEALQAQGVPPAYLALLAEMYRGQSGHLREAEDFQIGRGVKQGDIISPLLFNAALECAMRRWKDKIGTDGLPVGERNVLTNIRYADDLMIYATSWEELVRMLEALVEELQAIGLHLNQKKSKIFTTSSRKPTMIEVAGEFVEVLDGQAAHKYLGRKISGNLGSRNSIEVAHRIQSAWAKFAQHRDILSDKNVCLRSRLRLFSAVVTPCVLFGLSTCALTGAQVESLNVVQRRMLRVIVGWVRLREEPWADTMRRMRDRVDRAMNIFPIQPWSSQLARRKFNLAGMFMKNQEDWPSIIIRWHPNSTNPIAFRSRGRPQRRWEDDFHEFTSVRFPGQDWRDIAVDNVLWNSQMEAFIAGRS